MKKIFFLILIILICNILSAEIIDFDTNLGDNIFTEIHYPGQIKHVSDSENNVALSFDSGETGVYYYRSVPLEYSDCAEVSFWANFKQIDLYSWYFSLMSPDYNTEYLTFYEGVDNVENVQWGKLRCIMPEGSFFTFCGLGLDWHKYTIKADFENNIYDFFIDDVLIMADLPLNANNYAGSFRICFRGYASKGQKEWLLDNVEVKNYSPNFSISKNNQSKSYILKKGKVNLFLDKTKGNIISLIYDKNNLLSNSEDLYKAENETEWFFAKEINDKVVKVKTESNKVMFDCVNVDLPNIKIKKIYEAENDFITKKVEFSGKGYFITWYSKTYYNSDFYDNSYISGYRYNCDSAQLTDLYSQGMRMSKDFALGLGVIREFVNDRFVQNNLCEPWPGAIFKKVYEDYLQEKSSAQIKFYIFENDVSNFYKYISSRKEYRDLFEFERPAWLKSLVCDTMYLTDKINYHKNVFPLNVTGTIWFLNPPWGNWRSESDPPKSLHPNPNEIAVQMENESENIKVSSYTNTLFDINSEIYKLNDESFFVFDKKGNKTDSGIPSDSGGVQTFFLQILNEKARKYWMDMHKDKINGWNMHFFYMDGPGAYEELKDWKLKKVIQSYDWLDFYKELKQIIVDNAKDKVFFTNGIQPVSDIGYIEWRDNHWKKLGTKDDWYYLAKSIYNFKVSEPKGYTICPTYGSEEAQPYINTYAICYGWLGHLPNEKYINYHLAALEMRGASVITDGIKNPWWIEKNPNYEACTLIKGNNIILNVINHSDKDKAVINLNLESLGLDENKEYYVSTLLMNDLREKEGKAFELINYEKTKINKEITVPLNKCGMLTSVIISPINVIVLNTGAKSSQTGINDCYGVKIVEKENKMSAILEYDNTEIFIPFETETNRGEPYKLGDIDGIKISFPTKGEYPL